MVIQSWIWNPIGMSFGFRPSIPTAKKLETQRADTGKLMSSMPNKQMMTYNVEVKNPSAVFHGLEKEEEEYIRNTINSSWVSEDSKQYVAEDMHKAFLEAKQAKAFLKDRESERINIWASNKSPSTNIALKASQFADIIRKWALSEWIMWIQNVPDNDVISWVMKQKPELNDAFTAFINWKINADMLNRAINWEQINLQWPSEVPEWQKKLWQSLRSWLNSIWVDSILWQKVATEEEAQAKIDEWRAKTIWWIMTDDFWALPSVIAWAISVPLKAWASIVDISWWLLWSDINANASIDNLVDTIWIDRDKWFNAGKIATEIWLSSAAVTGMLSKVSKVWQIANMIKANPWITKYIARPVLESLWYQWLSDLQQWELSSPKAYATSVILWTALNSVAQWWSDLIWAMRNPNKWMQWVLKNIDDDFVKKTINDVDWFVNNPWARNPLQNIVDDIDDAISKVSSNKKVVWWKIWDIRKTMRTVSNSIDDSVWLINRNLRENDIAANIIKKKWKYVLAWSVAKSEWQWTILKEIVSQLNSLDELWIKNKMAWLDKVNQYMKFLSNTSKMDWSLKNAIWKSTSEFTKKIDSLLSDYWVARWDYSKLSRIEELASSLSSEWWSKAKSLLKKATWPWEAEDVIQILSDLKDLWFTDSDIYSKLVTTNYIMASKLWKDRFMREIETFFPSQFWLLNLWIKWWLAKLTDKVKWLMPYVWWFDDVANITWAWRETKKWIFNQLKEWAKWLIRKAIPAKVIPSITSPIWKEE